MRGIEFVSIYANTIPFVSYILRHHQLVVTCVV